MRFNYNIVITGGSGRFGSVLKQEYRSPQIFYPIKKELNIISVKSIEKYLKKIKPKILIHLAGLSRPMNSHDKYILKSIDLNIIGTANIVKVCSKLNIKLIYFSTSYIYPNKKGNHKETDPIHPVNNYAWSKLGGESAVQMYKNSLILRVCMTEKPFIHKKAFTNVKTNFIYHNEVAKILFKLLNQKGIINLGGKTQSPFDFAKKQGLKVKKIYIKKNSKNSYPVNCSMNLNKLKKIIY
jgi:dTDP-4-dehydrorhamnose reductase